MAMTWKEQLQNILAQQRGPKLGDKLYRKYSPKFSVSYIDAHSPNEMLADIQEMETLSDQEPLKIIFYRDAKAENTLHLRLFQWQKPLPLSDILPMLENLDLRVYNERPYQIGDAESHAVWISDFSVIYTSTPFAIEKVTTIFQEAFTQIYFGQCENDGLNKLVINALFPWREITIIRAYAKYLRQVGFRFSQPYIEKALLNNIEITKNLLALYKTGHDPKLSAEARKKTAAIENEILQKLDAVTNLDEDRILRRMLDLIKATVRTNYFQTTEDGKPKDYLAFKIHSRAVPELPLPVPLYEIFVYSPRFEAIHLRNTKVARGGIRWSDRPEDFRTEILGLMKAQKVKNAIIVPSGAKGGFVLKKLSSTASRDAVRAEVITCYQAFIRGLLDLTDNIQDKKIIKPAKVVCYDDSDPYLVVAADKGTATFSDTANAIANDYGFWLGDAFASGGKTGYDHKKIGITAKGAWESVKRHFRELGIDAEKTPITTVGIGDMSGDVFGNGMLYSSHIKLVAAFDHRHIFLDPNPDLKQAYNERRRLFVLPASSWADYNAKLISKGGGVYKRTEKSIPISAEMKAVLNITANALSPADLIRAILSAPVDLLWNGGIGTFVKASQESHADVGDRTNDFCRINGNELHVKVVGEGGNLGFTQLGRIEYALNGGLINTDFIDNSAGVDCSDHEVNLKILLDKEVRKKRLTTNKRNQLLAHVTEEVASLVLQDNYQQALVMSFSAFHAKQNVGLHQNYIKHLETLGELNRQVEYLPDDKRLIERKAQGQGLARPELAVLLAYTKIHIKHEILKTELPEDAFLRETLATAFPASLHKTFKSAMQEHDLHRDIIATQLSNQIVNEMGITFVYRVQMEMGASVEEIVRAYTVASRIFESNNLRQQIEALGFKIPLSTQYEMLYNIRNLINLATRWFLHSNRIKGELKKIIQHYGTRIKMLANIVPDLMVGFTKEYLETLTQDFLKAGLSKELARHIGTFRAIYTVLNIIEIATEYHYDLVKTAKVYFCAGERFNLVWFRDQIASDHREGHWNTLARLTLRDELDILQRALTIAIMANNGKEQSAYKLIEQWVTRNERVRSRWENLLGMLHSSANIDYSMFFIATRELFGLILSATA